MNEILPFPCGGMKGSSLFRGSIYIRGNKLPMPVKLFRDIGLIVYIHGHALTLFEAQQWSRKLSVISGDRKRSDPALILKAWLRLSMSNRLDCRSSAAKPGQSASNAPHGTIAPAALKSFFWRQGGWTSESPHRNLFAGVAKNRTLADFISGSADDHLAGLEITRNLDQVAVGRSLRNTDPLCPTVRLPNHERPLCCGDNAGLQVPATTFRSA